MSINYTLLAILFGVVFGLTYDQVKLEKRIEQIQFIYEEGKLK